MQIYYLDPDPKLCAQYHTDVHCCKMITESVQIMSTVCHIYNQPELAVYKATHRNHPSVRWCAETDDNFLWLYKMTYWLYEEYKHRYGKLHLAGEKFKNLGIPYIGKCGFTPIRYGFKDERYHLEDHVEGYRRYLIEQKGHLIKYTNREIPAWLKEALYDN